MNPQFRSLKIGVVLAFWLCAAAAYSGTIGVGPAFDPGGEISDAVKLRYHARVNKMTADTLKIIFQTRRLYNPNCTGPNCQTYLLESNLYTYWVQYNDTGCVPWPPTNAGPSRFGQAALWLSIPDYNQKGMVGSRPVDTASGLMFPRVMSGIDNITALTKIETMSQMDIAGQDMTIEYARGSTFTTPLSGWGWRFDPNSTVSSGQPPCVPDLPAGVVYRIWTATATIGGQTYTYEFAVPDQYATHLAPYEIFSIVTEFLDKTSTEISQGKGDFQAYFWDFEVQRENSQTWIPLRKMKVFYRADPTPNIGWGAKIGVYSGRPVLEISNDTTDTYYKLDDVFEIPATLQGGAVINSVMHHSVALKNDGTVWTWGENVYGQLGDGTSNSSTTPVSVPSLSGVVAISAGAYHTVALKADGMVWAWGRNLEGELGDGTTIDRNAPIQVPGLSGVVAISSYWHTVALKADGTVWTWGRNLNGELGNGTFTSTTTPEPVKMQNGVALSDVAAIAAGAFYTVALKKDGTVWAWGNNYYGQLGYGSMGAGDNPNPVQVPGLSGVVAISVDGYHTVALKGDGTVWTWGYNQFGQLGNGTSGVYLISTTPVQVQGPNGAGFLTGVVAIAGGYKHTVALKADGTVWAWGWNAYGQLGNGTTIDQTTPVAVNLSDVAAIAAGNAQTVALKKDGTVWAWGWNQYGQLGDGTIGTNRSDPVQVLGEQGNGYLNLLSNSTLGLNPIGDKTVDEGQTLTFIISATGPNGTALTYSTSTLPTGASFNPATRTFTWTPGYDQAGTYPVTFTVSNGTASVSETITITVNDVDRPPVLSLPNALTVEATEPSGATVTYSATATDDLDPNPVVTCAPASGSLFALGNTVVNCTATDSAGHSSQGGFTVAVVDTTPPTLALPPNMTVEGNTRNGANVTLPTVTASDLVDAAPTVACNPASGFFPLGNTSVQCTATDASKNKGTGSYQVHVVDTRVPFLRMNRVSAPQYGWLPRETATTFPARVGATPVGLEVRALDLVGLRSVTIAGRTAGGGPEFWTVNDLALTAGSNPLTVLATDLAGNQTPASGEVVLNLDLDSDRIRNDVDLQPKLPSYDFSDQFTTSLGRYPMDVAVSPDGTRAYVVNNSSGSVSVIDTATLEVIATVNVGSYPTALALSPNGARAYVTNASGYLSVIDTFSAVEVARVSGGTDEFFSDVAVSPNRAEAYVAIRSVYGGHVRVLDTTTNRWSTTFFPTGYSAYSLGLNADGTRLAVGTRGISTTGVFFIFDTVSRSRIGYKDIGDATHAVAVHPVTGDYYVARYSNRDLMVLDAALQPKATIPVGCGSYLNGLAFTPDSSRLYVTCYTDPGSVKVIDPATARVIGSIPVGSYLMGVTFNPDGLRAYVANYGGESVAVIDVPNGWVTDELKSDTTEGTSFGRIIDLGDQTQSLRVEDAELPAGGVMVTADAAGGPTPASIQPCGLTNYTFRFRAGSSGEIYCGSVDLRVLTGSVEVGFTTTEGTQGHAQVSAGNGLILDPPLLPLDPPFSIRVPDTNASPVVVTIDGKPMVLEPGKVVADADGDGITDQTDNCPTVNNPNQLDANSDGYGDACVPLDVHLDKGVVLHQPVVIGNGAMIKQDTMIGADAKIGREVTLDKSIRAGEHLKIGDRASVDKEGVFGNNVTLGASVNLDKGVQIGDGVAIGDGTRVGQNTRIGAASLIGQNCVIDKNIRIGARVILGDGVRLGKGAVVPDGTVLR